MRYPNHHSRSLRAFREAHPEWPKRRFLFYRFARILGMALLLLLAGMAGLSYLLSRLMNEGRHPPFPGWAIGLGLVLIFPLLAIILGIRSFVSFANPIARVMTAADAVAEGDLSVRVPEIGTGEFRRLASSFNRMVSELERSDQLRRNLMADVAHELRTPLHIIQGKLEGILDEVYQPSPDEVNLLWDQTRQLSRLVEDLRTLSLAEAGQLSIKHEPVKILELLKDVVTSFSGPAEVAGIDLHVEAESESTSPVVSGDAGRLDQVLSNLVANALRHTPQGGKIILGVATKADRIQLQVSDNGSGIDPQDLLYIFDRFWSGDRSTVRSGGEGGSGLGLAIARQLVQAHGGKISVVSQLQQGTIFTIDLPLMKST